MTMIHYIDRLRNVTRSNADQFIVEIDFNLMRTAGHLSNVQDPYERIPDDSLPQASKVRDAQTTKNPKRISAREIIEQDATAGFQKFKKSRKPTKNTAKHTSTVRQTMAKKLRLATTRLSAAKSTLQKDLTSTQGKSSSLECKHTFTDIL